MEKQHQSIPDLGDYDVSPTSGFVQENVPVSIVLYIIISNVIEIFLKICYRKLMKTGIS